MLMNGKSLRGFLLLVAVLLVTLFALFHKSFVPDQALFANDGPLGVLMADYYGAPGGFVGVWDNLHWVGMYGGHFFAIPTYLLLWLLGPIPFAKFYAPVTALVLGICAWIFFRRIGNPRVAVLGSIAAALNMNFFSNAAWGLGTRGLSLGATFLALAAIEAGMARRWMVVLLTSVLAGFGVGWSLLEGGDNGAIFSLFVGSYAVFRTWADAPAWRTAGMGILKGGLIAACAVIMAFPTLEASFRTAGKTSGAPSQETQSPQQKWDFATQWSLPKIETLRVIIPGLFGYRMDTPEGGNYWGRVGEAPGAPQQMPRYSGAGEYAGVLVVLIAIWAVVESFRTKGLTFSPIERRVIWFWVVAALIAMLAGWGRHGPLGGLFFRIFHELPGLKDMRNAMKFFHALHLCLMILFAYGLLGLSRRFLDVASKPGSLGEQFKAWWNKPSPEKSWAWVSLAGVALAAVAWFGYLGSRRSLVKHLQEAGFPDAGMAAQIARFSTNEVLIFTLLLALCVAVLVLILSGAFAGRRAGVVSALMGLILVLDLGRSNKPWIIHYNWKEKYASNPIIDILKDKPHEHRVTVVPFQINQQLGMLQQYYQVEWLQHHFPFYNIQSIDMSQDPRPAADKVAFRQAVKDIGRLWQLTNTRYLLGLGGQLPEMLNQQLDPKERRFRQHTAFTLFQQPNSQAIGVETNANGPFALIEFTGALPRAKLYSNWEVLPNDNAVLTRLGDTNWNPAQTVLLSGDAPKSGRPGAAPGTATITDAARTKEVHVKTVSESPAMLLLNDKMEPEWQVTVDGKPAKPLKANYLMRAVEVPAGKHDVVFKWEMKPKQLWIVGSCDLAGLVLLGVLWAVRRKEPHPATRPA
jgi:hypothetical protein